MVAPRLRRPRHRLRPHRAAAAPAARRAGRARSAAHPRSGGPRRRRRPVPRRVPPRRQGRGAVVALRAAGWRRSLPFGGWFDLRPRSVLAFGRPFGLRVVTMVVALRDRDGGPRRRDRRSGAAPSSSCFALSPFLEGRAHRKRARQAVRLLVGDGARRRMNLGVTAVTVIRSVGALVPVVLEGDEGAGRRSVRMGHAAFGHRADDTRPARPRPV